MPETLDYRRTSRPGDPIHRGPRVSQVTHVASIALLLGCVLSIPTGHHHDNTVAGRLVPMLGTYIPAALAITGLIRTRLKPNPNFALPILVLALSLPLPILMTYGFILSPPPGANVRHKVKCASNLRQIGLGAILYADGHRGGAMPPDLQAILDTQDITANAFTCPATRHAATGGGFLEFGVTSSYIWTARGLTNRAGRGQPLAFEPLANHAFVGGNVLYADGSVTFETPATVKTLVAAEVAAGRLTCDEAAVLIKDN